MRVWAQVAIALVFVGVVIGACSSRTVFPTEAVEVSVRSDQDREDLAAILRASAKRHGMFFRDDSTYSTEAGHGDESVHMTLFRPLGGKEWPEVDVSDLWHLGTPWVTFNDGLDSNEPPLARLARADLIRQLRDRWPTLREVPLLPSGGLPNWQDLRATSTGYKIAAGAAQKYELNSNSTVVAASTDAIDPGRTSEGREAYCLKDASVTDLANASMTHLAELRKHYSYCRFDPHSTDLVIAELVRRGDRQALFDSAIRADLQGDRTKARSYLIASAAKGDAEANDALDRLNHGGDP